MKFNALFDALEAEIHEMDYPEDWKGWTEEFLTKKKRHYFTDFPELLKTFDTHLRKNGYFST